MNSIAEDYINFLVGHLVPKLMSMQKIKDAIRTNNGQEKLIGGSINDNN